MPLTQLIYCSRVRIDAARFETELASILATAVRMNSIGGITGCLGHNSEWFLQVLEGSEDAVLRTFARIKHDHRHSNVQVVSNRNVRGRSFPDWSMTSVSMREDAPSFLSTYGVTGKFTPEATTASQLLMILMELADRQRLKR